MEKRKLSISEALGIIEDCVNQLKNNNFNIKLSDIDKIDFFDNNYELGECRVVGTKKYVLKLNKKLLYEHKIDYFKCVIYHELAHVIQYNEAYDYQIIAYDEVHDEVYSITSNKNLANNTIFDGDGHTQLWLTIAKEINHLLKLDPRIRAYVSKDYLDKFLEETIMKPLYRKSSLHIDREISGFTAADLDDDLDNIAESSDSQERRDFDKIRKYFIETDPNYVPDHSYRKLLVDPNAGISIEEKDCYEVPDDICMDEINFSAIKESLPESKENYFSLDELKAKISYYIEKLNSIGYHLSISQIIKYEILPGTATTAGVKSIAKNKYLFVIAKAALKKTAEAYLEPIIYHELCHILQLESLFNLGALFYENNKLYVAQDQADIINKWYKENAGHTELWYLFARRINRILKPKIHVAQAFSNEALNAIFLTEDNEENLIEIDP